MAGQDAPPHFYSAADRDGDFDGAVPTPEAVAQAWDEWRAEAAFADQFVAEAPSLDIIGKIPDSVRPNVAALGAGPHSGGVRPSQWPRQPAPRAHRRQDRPVTIQSPAPARETAHGTSCHTNPHLRQWQELKTARIPGFWRVCPGRRQYAGPVRGWRGSCAAAVP
jgi:hypothetical protein